MRVRAALMVGIAFLAFVFPKTVASFGVVAVVLVAIAVWLCRGYEP